MIPINTSQDYSGNNSEDELMVGQHQARFYFILVFKKLIYLFIHLWLCWVVVAVPVPSSVAGSLLISVHEFLILVASLVVEQGSCHLGFSSYSTWAQ